MVVRRFYGFNLSEARRLRNEIYVLKSRFNKCKKDKFKYVGLIVEKRKELNSLIIKGEPFELYKGLEIS
jgi:hypothetical protein